MSEIKLPKIHVNAEFQRLWWTNVHWGLLMGVVLVFGLFLITKNEYKSWHNHLIEIGMMGMSVSFFAGYIFLERSLKNDITANAFDQLRMSSLSVWQMVWSRIVVAPLVAWVLFVISWLSTCYGWKILSYDDPVFYNNTIFVFYLPLVAWAVACVLLANALPTGRDNRRWHGSVVQLIALYILGMMWGISLLEELDTAGVTKTEVVQVDAVDMLVSLALAAVMASVYVWARMASVLHLKRVDWIYGGLAVLSPVLCYWGFVAKDSALAVMVIMYSGFGFLSLATQGTQVSRSRVPVWVWVVPLGLLCTFLLQIDGVWLVWLHMLIFATIIWLITQMRWGVNAITVGFVVYFLGHLFWNMFM